MEFWALAVVAIWGVDQQLEDLALSLPFPLITLPFKYIIFFFFSKRLGPSWGGWESPQASEDTHSAEALGPLNYFITCLPLLEDAQPSFP